MREKEGSLGGRTHSSALLRERAREVETTTLDRRVGAFCVERYREVFARTVSCRVLSSTSMAASTVRMKRISMS
jgi:hypothetical protein